MPLARILHEGFGFYAQAPPGVSLVGETNNQPGALPDMPAFEQYRGGYGQDHQDISDL